MLHRAQRKLQLEYQRLTAGLRVHPQWIIIGAQKGGTSSVFEYLSQHPQCAPSSKKEVRFFDENFRRGMAWYRGHFAYRWDANDKHAFEASPNYLFTPHTARRVADAYPAIKLIALLRNPIDRAFSHYQMNHRRPQITEDRTFFEAIQNEAQHLLPEYQRMVADESYWNQDVLEFSYLARGHYAEQLQRWYAAFSREQILVMQSEYLFAEPAAAYQDILKFLALDDYQPAEFAVHNPTTYRSKLSEEAQHWAEAYFQPHNAALYELLGTEYDW